MEPKYQKENEHLYAQLIAKVWADDTLRKNLLENPIAAMREMGIVVPDGVEVAVVEDTSKKVHFVIPNKPSEEEMKEIDLSKLTWAYESNSSGPGSLC